MFDTRDIPDFFNSITFDNGICVEFNEESMIIFYDSNDDGEVMRLDPSDLTTLYSAYRGMVREKLEEDGWSNKEIL
jgi:hypothetical protein